MKVCKVIVVIQSDQLIHASSYGKQCEYCSAGIIYYNMAVDTGAKLR